MASKEPQFATVTLLSADESEKTTFRVPIASDTTVRQLAKEAMRRFVLSRRHATSGPSLPAVTQVYVGGHSTQPSAELFAHDVVTQVMLVKDEIVYMRLRDNGSGAPAAKEAPPVEKPSSAASAPATAPVPVPAPPPPAVVEVPAAPKGGALKEKVVNEVSSVVAEKEATSRPPRVEKENARKKPTTATTAAAANTRKAVKPVKKETAKEKKKDSPYDVARRERRAEAEVEPAVAEIQARERQRMGWSSTYHQDFAANYVSSPEKLFRSKRRQKTVKAAPAQEADRKRERTEVEGRPTVAPKRACVARHIDFEDAAAEDKTSNGRGTVGHDVDLVTEESPAKEEEKNVSIPKGWGAQSLKYFDPDTYCDNPAKAVLSSTVLARPMLSRYAN